MSKFFAGGDSSSSESSDDSDSEPEILPQKVATKGRPAMVDSDSDSDEEKRVVKSHKDKATEGIMDSIVKIRNSMKINEWSMIYDEFGKVNAAVEKGRAKNGVPKSYIKMLGDLSDFVVASIKDKEAVRKMKKPTAHALNQMKLGIRKQCDKFRADVDQYKATPEAFAEELATGGGGRAPKHDSSDSDSDSDSSDSGSDSSDDDEDGDSDESDFDTDDSSDDSSVDSDNDGKPKLVGRAKWLKKTPTVKKTFDSDDEGPVEQTDEEAAAAAIAAAAEEDRRRKKKEQELIEKMNAAALRSKAEMLDTNMTEEALTQKVNEIVASRGKKGTDVRAINRQLEVLTKIARVFGPFREIPVLMHLISSMFDANKLIDDYLDLLSWRSCYRHLARIVHILDENKKLVLQLLPNEDLFEVSGDPTAKDEKDEATKKTSSKYSVKVTGTLESFITRLEADYTRSLQQINPHTQEYIHRLSDEAMLIELAEQIQAYYVRVGEERSASEVALLHVEHMYYKHDNIAQAVNKAHVFKKTFGRYGDVHPACQGKPISAVSPSSAPASGYHPAAYCGTPTVSPPPYNSSKKLEELCNYVFSHGSERSKTRALLCAVFHNALHDRYHEARDMFLISHVQDSIDKTDTGTQILYNRALVSMGLSAFRLGLIKKAHDCLSGVCSGRMKELLAQGQSKSMDPDQERLERRRQVPYHMHINPDLLECCHLTSAMLLELPVMTRGVSSHVISKHFRLKFMAYSTQVFTGPPENTRDSVLSAAKSLSQSDWARACELLLGLEVWNLLSEMGSQKVKAMLSTKLKEEALRIYLFTQGAHYESISLQHLVDLFQMDPVDVRRTTSKMINVKEISGAWDLTPVETLVLYRINPTPTQLLSAQVSEKVSQLVESNERLLDPLFGVYGYKDEWQGRDKSKQWPGEGHRKPYDRYRGNTGGRGYGPSSGRGRGSGRSGDRAGGGRGSWSGGRGDSGGRGGRGSRGYDDKRQDWKTM